MLFFLDGLHQFMYIVHVLPFFAILLAIAGRDALSRFQPRTAIAAMGVFAVLQLTPAVRDIRKNSYATEYLPIIDYLRTHWKAGTTVIGPSELSFELGFGRHVRDDVRLGYFTGVRPDFIVVGTFYKNWIAAAPKQNPALYAHVKAVLDAHDLVLETPLMKIYRPRALTVN